MEEDVNSITRRNSQIWLDNKATEWPYRAVHPKPIDPAKVTTRAVSAVITEGERTFAFRTEADRAEFLGAHPLARSVS